MPAEFEAAIAEEKSGISKPKQAEIVAVNFESPGGVAAGLVTPHPKPAKRLNAKERAKAKVDAKADTKDGTKPDTKATAKSKMAAKAAAKAEAKARRKTGQKDKDENAAAEPARSE